MGIESTGLWGNTVSSVGSAILQIPIYSSMSFLFGNLLRHIPVCGCLWYGHGIHQMYSEYNCIGMGDNIMDAPHRRAMLEDTIARICKSNPR